MFAEKGVNFTDKSVNLQKKICKLKKIRFRIVQVKFILFLFILPSLSYMYILSNAYTGNNILYIFTLFLSVQSEYRTRVAENLSFYVTFHDVKILFIL